MAVLQAFGVEPEDPPVAQALSRATADRDPIILRLLNCQLLAEHRTGLSVGASCDLHFHDGALRVGYGGSLRLEWSYEQIEEVAVGGAGAVREGGGFFGGGFGAEGPLQGMAIASVLNALTTRTRFETLVGVRAELGEVLFLFTGAGPEQTRIDLTPVLRRLASKQSEPQASPDDAVARLMQASELLDRGLLTRDEFERLKQRVLAGE